MDWLGTRRDFPCRSSSGRWRRWRTPSSDGHGFSAARFALGWGVGEFPRFDQDIAEWFPKKERALATGIFNAGSNVGAVITPIVVPWITITYGWRWAFIATGALGFIWLAFWLALYRRPRRTRTSPPASSPSSGRPGRLTTRSGGATSSPQADMAFAIGKS